MKGSLRLDLGEALRDRAVTLCFLGMGGLLIGAILAAAGAGAALICVLAAAYLLTIGLWLLAGALAEGMRSAKLEKLLEELPEAYLLGEVLPGPANGVEKRYFRMMREVSRSAVGIAEQARREKDAYCDYVESWIHEIRTPLTACFLMLENGGDARGIRRELKRIDHLTESILYYARLRTAEKDVKIRAFSVADTVGEAVKSQMELLMFAKIGVETEGDFVAWSDEKSLCFVLKQLLVNCAKYCRGARVRILAADGTISVWDDGPGIPAHELCRVTQRGFTGARWSGHITPDVAGERNGEQVQRASGGTGMGLYLVKELCDRLGIELGIASKEGEYTCVTLSFPSWDAKGCSEKEPL